MLTKVRGEKKSINIGKKKHNDGEKIGISMRKISLKCAHEMRTVKKLNVPCSFCSFLYGFFFVLINVDSRHSQANNSEFLGEFLTIYWHNEQLYEMKEITS